ncbi:hypothetical protein PSMA108079_01905 [Pseudoalteromonas mariniglutinosa]
MLVGLKQCFSSLPLTLSPILDGIGLSEGLCELYDFIRVSFLSFIIA